MGNLNENYKTSRGKHRRKSCDLGLGSNFLDIPPKAWKHEGKNDKLDFIKIESFCCSKDTVKKTKIHFLDVFSWKIHLWENIFAELI